MTDSPTTLADRMREARLLTAARRRATLTQAQMADLVTAELPKGQKLFQAQWSLYERGESEPALGVIQATARVSGLDPAYLAFGIAAPPAAAGSVLDLDPTRDRLVTDEELDRAERLVAARAQAKQMATKRNAGGKGRS